MLVQVENLPEYRAEVEERDREVLEQEEVLERGDLLRDDGEEEVLERGDFLRDDGEEDEGQVVVII